MPGPEAAPGITRVASTQNISTPACTLQHYTSHITIAIITIHTILCGGCHEHINKSHYVDIIKYLFYIYRDTWIQVSSLVYIYMATRVQHECLQDILIIVYNYCIQKVIKSKLFSWVYISVWVLFNNQTESALTILHLKFSPSKKCYALAA